MEPETVLPDGCPEIVFNLSDRFVRLHDHHEETQPAALFAGQMSRRILIRPSGSVRLFGVRLQPGAASAFLGFPAHEATNQIIDLAAIGRTFREIEGKINEAKSFAERIDVFEHFFMDRLQGFEIDQVAFAASEAIVRTDGLLKVSALAASLGISERRLERSFAQTIGLPPKTLSRIVRFQSAVRAFQDGVSKGFLDAALQFGYYDQSHLIRDFKEFSGVTPQTYFGRANRLSDMFTGLS